MARTLYHTFAVATVCVAAISQTASAAPAGPVRPSDKFAEARQSESDGRWEEALTEYCRLYQDGLRTPDIREHIHECLRRVLQTRRHQDDAFRAMLKRFDLTASLDLYAELVEQIRSLYPEPDRSELGALLRAGFEEFDRALADPVFVAAHLGDASSEQVDQFRQRVRLAADSRDVRSPRDARAVVREVARSAEREFGASAVVPTIVEFLCGACNSLDEYSTFLSPSEIFGTYADPALDLWAFGVRLAIQGPDLIIAEVIPGSLAETRAMFRVGVRVVAVNGKPVVSPTAESVAELLSMREQGWIELSVLDVGSMSPRLVALPAELPTVLGSMMLKPGVGYLRIVSFRASTIAELDEQVVGLQGQGMQAMILDLRGNPGGGLVTAVNVAERFLSEGEIVAVLGRHPGLSRTFVSSGGMGAWTFPVVLLIDGDTASAAEVLAAAMKARQRAILVGEPTYGKASMQTLIRSKVLAEAALRLTVARLLGPDGDDFDGVGVVPDVAAVGPGQLDVAIQQAEQTLAMMP